MSAAYCYQGDYNATRAALRYKGGYEYTDDAVLYDRLAPLINSRYPAAHGEQNRLVTINLARCANPEPILIDIGCGTCPDLDELARVERRLSFMCLDRSPSMLRIAAKKVVDARCKNRATILETDFLEGGACRFSKFMKGQLRGRKADAIISAYALHHQTRNEKWSLYGALADLLDDRGFFVLTDLIAPDTPAQKKAAFEAEISDLRRGFNRAEFLTTTQRSELLRKWLYHYRYENRPGELADEIALLREAGFRSVHLTFRNAQNCVLIARKIPQP